MNDQTLQIGGVAVNSTELVEVLAFVIKKLAKKEKFWIATPNPEMIMRAQTDPEFKKNLNLADWAIPDGSGIVWASKILVRRPAEPIQERVTGVDLMENLCRRSAEKGWKVFFLGGKGEVAEKALEVLRRRYVGLKGMAEEGPSIGVSEEGLEIGEEENKKTIEKINKFKPDLLFVGFGMGKQERWVAENLDKLQIGGAMVVGGAFDFISGEVKRSPILLQKIGLEWFWRLCQQPWRIKRQTALVRFVFLVARQKLKRSL